MRESSLCIQPLIRLFREFSHAPLLKELGRDSFTGRFVGNMLGAVFTKLEMRTLAIRLRPCATGTINSAHLIHLQQCPHTTNKPHLS